MPAVASIALDDAQATPVTHTFIPLGPDADGVWWFEDQSAASPIGNWRISVKLKRPPPAANAGQNSANRFNKAELKLYFPILENVTNSTVSGVAAAPTISYVNTSKTEFTFPERASLQNRKDARKMAYNLLANANVISVVETLQSYY